MRSEIIELADDRELCFSETGDLAGTPVFFMHGTTADRRQASTFGAAPADLGIRLITPDRPGYGHSTHAPARILADWADDVRAVADHLCLDEFGVVAHSGGGPHALAVARFAPERVSAVAICGGSGPLAAPGSDVGMHAGLRVAVRVARRFPRASHLPYVPMAAVAPRSAALAMANFVRMAPVPDRPILRAEPVARDLQRAMARPAPTQARACGRDAALMASHWGFELEDITVPVTFWQGDADTWTPPAHAELMARRVPNAELRTLPGAGHFFYIERAAEILQSVT